MVTNDFSATEKNPAYQRWEMNSFETPNIEPEPEPEIDIQEPEKGESEKVALPTEGEVVAIFQQAKEEGRVAGHQEGYQTGFQEGHAAGYAEGRKTAEVEVKAEADRIHSLLNGLDQDLHAMDLQVATDLLDLAIALTHKMVTQALKVKPDLILPIVQEAIRNLPKSMQHPRLYLHPDDAQLVHAYLNGQLKQDNWSIREDEQLSRGGCRIEAGGSEIDGSTEVRWQRVLSAIGQNNSWLEQKD